MGIIIHNVQNRHQKCRSEIIPTPKQPNMKASEARKLTEAQRPSSKNLYAKIRETALKGDDVLHHYLRTDLDRKYADDLINELKLDGYDVTRQTGEDTRDGTTWDYIVICW